MLWSAAEAVMKSLACLVFLAGCTGNSNTGTTAGTTAGTTGTTTSGTTGGTTGSTTGGTTGTVGDTVTLQSETFKVPAGGEVFVCQDFKNPFGGVDTDVQAFESHMSPGSHHLLLFYKNNAADGSLAPCSGLEFSPTPYGAQSPDAMVVYPDGIGALVKGTQGFHLNMHYVNASQSDLMAQVTILLHKAKAGTVMQHAGLFFFNNVTGIYIPAGQQKTISATCTFNKDVNLLYATAHMHKYSLSMTATVNGNTIYTTDTWDAAPLQPFTPPLMLTAGTSVTWTSIINNTSGSTLTFGESAMTNEMSIFDGQYYPADPANPTIQCMR
jgi:hypothetical protein